MSRGPLTLLDAVRDPNLLGGALPEPWPSQLELCAMLDAPDLSTLLLACGRGSSKTTLCALAAIYEAALRVDLDGILAPSRTRYVIVGGPSEEQAREFIKVCSGIVKASPVLRNMAECLSDRIEFTSVSGAPTAIKSLPCRAESVRGMSASMCVADEFAHFGTTDGSSSARAMFEAMDGSMVPFGDRAKWLLISTPKGTGNAFEEKFKDITGGVIPRAKALQRPTWEMRPDLSQEYLDRKRLELGEASFLQEIGAQFIDAGGSFFDLREVHFTDHAAKPEDASSWTVSLDPAFAGDNFGVACVGPSASEPERLVVGPVEAITPGSRLKAFTSKRAREDRVLARVAEIIKPLADARQVQIISDVHQRDAVEAYFGQLGYIVKIEAASAKVKTAQFVSTRSRLVDGSLQCWAHPELVAEMRRVQARDTETIVLPRVGSSHCDLISALAQGVYRYKAHTGIPQGKPRAPLGHTLVPASALGGIGGGRTQRELLEEAGFRKGGDLPRSGRRRDPDRAGHYIGFGNRMPKF